MIKNKKILLSFGALGIVCTPLITIVSCGMKSSGFANLRINAIKVQGPSAAMNKVLTEDISATASWGDSIYQFIDDKNRDKIHVVGVEKNRITNDGIQVRGNMKADDQKAIQLLFKDLITLANAQKVAAKAGDLTNVDLLIKVGTKYKTVFDVYSHSDYKSLSSNDKIGVLNGKKLIEKNAIGGSIGPSKIFKASNTELFAKASKAIAINKASDFSRNYKTKKDLKITFIPANDPSKIVKATTALQKYLNKIGVKANITISTDYDAAASSIEKNQTDIAFLSAGTWSSVAPSSNFILQASRPTQIATLNFENAKITLPGNVLKSEYTAVKLFNKYKNLRLQDVTTIQLNKPNINELQRKFKTESTKVNTLESKVLKLADKSKGEDFITGSYESWIFTKKDSAFDKMVFPKAKVNTPWTMPIKKVSKILKYGYTSTTSSSSYEFPELWFAEHFVK